MELTKKDTKMLQGLSVLAMVCLHLFNRNYEGLFQPLLFIQGTPVSFYISQLSDFCVMGFAFCSGYAHMLLYDQEGYYKKRIRSLFSLMKNFWLILIIFTIASVVIGQAEFMPGSAMKFLKNALCLENSYNGAWWYMYTYIILVVISPVILKFIKMSPPMFSLGIGFAIYCVAYLIRFKIPVDNWFLIKFGPFGMTLFEYMLGAVFCERKLFTRIHEKWIKLPKYIRVGVAIGTVAAMLYVRTKIVPSLAVAPMTGLVIICLFHFWKKPQWAEKFFMLIGKHSTNIWLIHMFFYAVLFKNLVYIAKYPILIFVLMIAITVIVSKVIMTIENFLTKVIKNLC